jgi:hypothetical protein
MHLWGWSVDRAYLELEITLSQEQVQKYTDCLQLYVNSTLKELRRLFLVQDLVDSLKVRLLKPSLYSPKLFSLKKEYYKLLHHRECNPNANYILQSNSFWVYGTMEIIQSSVFILQMR